MKKLLIILLVVLTLGGCSENVSKEMQMEEESIDFKAIGSEIIMYLSLEAYNDLVSNVEHSQEMEDAVDSGFYQVMWTTLRDEYGDYQSFEFTSNTTVDGYEIYSYEVFFTSHSVNFNIVLAQNGDFSGINYQEKELLIE